MKRSLTLFALLLIWAVTASATLPPVRIAVTTFPALTAPVTDGGILTIDVLSSDGGTTRATIPLGHEVPTDAGGVISVVLTTGSWTTLTYNKDDLVRITYNGVVLSIERMEVVFAKQGLFGANIDPGEIAPSTNGYVLSTNNSGVTSWQAATEVVKSANMNWFYMPSISFNTASLSSGAKRDLYELYNEQFTGSDLVDSPDVPPAEDRSSSFVKSTGAPAFPNIPTRTNLYYYITYYDTTVFSNVSIDANGVMTYDVISAATPSSFINIVFVIK